MLGFRNPPSSNLDFGTFYAELLGFHAFRELPPDEQERGLPCLRAAVFEDMVFCALP